MAGQAGDIPLQGSCSEAGLPRVSLLARRVEAWGDGVPIGKAAALWSLAGVGADHLLRDRML